MELHAHTQLLISGPNGDIFSGDQAIPLLTDCRKKLHMPQKIEDELLTKIDRIMRLLATNAIKGLTQREQIAILNQVGFPPREIADLVGTSSNTVRVELVALRKAGARKNRSTD